MATAIDDNAVDEKLGKSIGWLFNIRCTSMHRRIAPVVKQEILLRRLLQ